MVNRHYATAYAVLFVVTLIGGLLPVAFSSQPRASVIAIVVVVAAVFPVLFIWLLRKMGYPVGQPVHCSQCGAQQPLVRKPATTRQALYGGYHCAGCGADLDARGRKRVT
jgi:hypothetical protein